HAVRAILLGVEDREMSADNLATLIAFDALGAGIPIGDETVAVKHENGVIDDALDENAEAALAFTQRGGPRSHALLERLIDMTERFLGLAPSPPHAREFKIGAHARHQLARAEGFRQIVVGAGIEALSARLLARARRKHDD